MGKIKLEITSTLVNNGVKSCPTDFENWLNEELDKRLINYDVNDKIIFDVIIESTWEHDSSENREKLLQKILSNPKIKTLKDIRKEKLEKINNK